jgi:4-amino-4-deoxy-L-arabinose transferase-like glycosyltransferase
MNWFWAPRDWCRALLAVRPGLGIAVVGLLAGPWYLCVGLKTDGAWLSGFLGTHNLGRYLNAMEGHSGPVFYYVVALLASFLPWSVFLPGALLHGVRNAIRDEPRQAACVLLLSWIGAFVVFFSLAATKLPNYVAPVLPALALLTASLLVQWHRTPSPFAIRWLSAAMAALVMVGVGVGVGAVVASAMLLPGAETLACVGVLPVAGGGVGFILARSGRLHLASLTVAAACVGLTTSLVGIASVRLSEHQDGRRIVEQARRLHGGRAPSLLAYGVSASSLVFYGHSPVGYLHSPEQIGAAWLLNPDALLVTRADLLESVNGMMEGRPVVCFRCRRFLRREELVLLSCAGAGARVARARAEGTR